MQNLNVTLVQTTLDWINRSANHEHFNELIGQIKDTDVVVLPETFTTGFYMHPKDIAEDYSKNETLDLMRSWSKNGFAVCGSILVYDEGHYFNRFLFVEPDGKCTMYNKRHLFRMAGENDSFTQGNKLVYIEYQGWKIAPFVCYDLRFPVWSRNTVGYDLAIYVANWPEARRQVWQTLLKARAMENQCYVVGVNRVGVDGNDIPYAGDSVVVDPKGNELIRMGDQAMISSQDLSMEALEDFREKFPVAMDADSFNINL